MKRCVIYLTVTRAFRLRLRHFRRSEACYRLVSKPRSTTQGEVWLTCTVTATTFVAGLVAAAAGRSGRVLRRGSAAREGWQHVHLFAVRQGPLAVGGGHPVDQEAGHGQHPCELAGMVGGQPCDEIVQGGAVRHG